MILWNNGAVYVVYATLWFSSWSVIAIIGAMVVCVSWATHTHAPNFPIVVCSTRTRCYCTIGFHTTTSSSFPYYWNSTLVCRISLLCPYLFDPWLTKSWQTKLQILRIHYYMTCRIRSHVVLVVGWNPMGSFSILLNIILLHISLDLYVTVQYAQKGKNGLS